MKHLSLWQLEMIPWWVFAAYWLITALRVKRTKEREKSADRLVTIVVVVAAYELLFAHWHMGRLELRFLPDETWIAWAGIAITWVGVALAIWARYCLGAYWSARVTLKEGHQPVQARTLTCAIRSTRGCWLGASAQRWLSESGAECWL